MKVYLKGAALSLYKADKNKKTALPESQPFRGGAVQRKGTGRQGNCLDAVVLWEGGDGAGPEKAEKSWCPVYLP